MVSIFKHQSGREFPHGQTALSVPSNNQKTMSQIDPRDESESSDGERRGGLPVITHDRCLWLLVHETSKKLRSGRVLKSQNTNTNFWAYNQKDNLIVCVFLHKLPSLLSVPPMLTSVKKPSNLDGHVI